MKLRWIALLTLLATVHAPAQEAATLSAPTPPLIAEPRTADWLVTVQYAVAPKPEDFRILEVRSTLAGKIKHDRITLSNHKVRDQWYSGSVLLWMTNTGRVVADDLSGSPVSDEMSPAVPGGFPGVAWVKIAAYTGAAHFENHLCHHYATAGREAWIDASTKLPVAYRGADGTLYRYQFNPTPAEALTLPPAFQKVAETLGRESEHRRKIEEAINGARQ